MEDENTTLEMVTPPFNFGIVVPKVYRSCVFNSESFGFVKELDIKSIVSLSPELPPNELKEFLIENGIEFVCSFNKLIYSKVFRIILGSSCGEEKCLGNQFPRNW